MMCPDPVITISFQKVLRPDVDSLAKYTCYLPSLLFSSLSSPTTLTYSYFPPLFCTSSSSSSSSSSSFILKIQRAAAALSWRKLLFRMLKLKGIIKLKRNKQKEQEKEKGGRGGERRKKEGEGERRKIKGEEVEEEVNKSILSSEDHRRKAIPCSVWCIHEHHVCESDVWIKKTRRGRREKRRETRIH